MAPEVPGSTLLPEIMDIGRPATRVPISVAQVSAADAASAPAPIANHVGEAAIRDPNAAPAYTPPFANTCPQSRSAPFSTIRPTRSVFLRSPSFESKLAEMNIERRSAPQLQPAAIEIVPTTEAAIAPLVESILTRCAASPVTTESEAPISAWVSVSVSCNDSVFEFQDAATSRSPA